MLEHFASFIAGKLLAIIPGWVARRFVSAEHLAFKLKIDLRGNSPGRLSDTGVVPELELWLCVTNHSSFPVVLDRADIDVWFGQPFAAAPMIERKQIEPHSDVESLRVVTYLSERQLHHVRQALESQSRPELTLQVTAYFVSKLGWSEVNTTIRRRDFPIALRPTG